MPRKTPLLRLHRPSGRAVVTFSDAKTKARRDVYCGPYGSPDTIERYHLLVGRWERDGRRLAGVLELSHRIGVVSAPTAAGAGDSLGPTIRVLIVKYLKYAEERYRKPDGTPTGHIDSIRTGCRILRALHDETPAAAFGPKALQEVREAMVGRGWARSTVNKHVRGLQRMFKWAAAQELVPAAVVHGLYAVEGLRRGELGVREGRKVRPVPLAAVEAVLPLLSDAVAAMVRLQMLTGMRSGEVLQLRLADIDLSGDVWAFRPASHKTEHHGHERVIFIGPEAQRVLRPFIEGGARKTHAYLFDPREGGSGAAGQAVHDRYDVRTYRRAVYRACDIAFPPPEHLQRQRVAAGGRKRTKLESVKAWRERIGPLGIKALRAWQKEHRWHPHQLRHLAATRLRREFGIEAAKLTLGHKSAGITEVYAERDLKAAQAIAAKVG